MALIEGIAQNIVASLILRAGRLPFRQYRMLKCRLVRPREEIRVAFSALLRLPEGDKFLLVRNLHRPETFGPFGGVYKHYESGRLALDKFLFRPHVVEPQEDMLLDLRGYLPRRHLPSLIAWFKQGEHCETPRDCVFRELREEGREVGLKRKIPTDIKLTRIRRVYEGPVFVPTIGIAQFRIFDIFELSPPTKGTRSLVKSLKHHAGESRNLVWASAQEIRHGRTEQGHVIGAHAAYLVGSRRYRSDDPMFIARVPPPADRASHRTSGGS